MTPDSNELLARVEAERIDSAFAEGVRACLQRLYAANVRTDEHHAAWEDCEALWRTRTDQVIASRVERKAAPVPSPDGAASFSAQAELHPLDRPLPSDDVRSALEHAEARFLCLVDHFKEVGEEALEVMSEVDAERMQKGLAALRSAPVSGPAIADERVKQLAARLIGYVQARPDYSYDLLLAHVTETIFTFVYNEILNHRKGTIGVPAVGVTREALAADIVSEQIGTPHARQAADRILAKYAVTLSPVPDATVSEPVAHRWRYKGSNGEWAYSAEYPKFVSFNLDSMDYEPLYTSPQHVDREATVSARDGVIAECRNKISDLRISEAGLFDAKHSGQRGEDRSDALYDACELLRSLASGAKP